MERSTRGCRRIYGLAWMRGVWEKRRARLGREADEHVSVCSNHFASARWPRKAVCYSALACHISQHQQHNVVVVLLAYYLWLKETTPHLTAKQNLASTRQLSMPTLKSQAYFHSLLLSSSTMSTARPHTQVIVYRPLAGALLSAFAAAIVPSRKRSVSSSSALPTCTSVSPSMRMYSLGSAPAGGSLPGG